MCVKKQYDEKTSFKIIIFFVSHYVINSVRFVNIFHNLAGLRDSISANRRTENER